MKRSIFKPILIGILVGAAVFFAPFLMLKMFCFMLILGLIFKFFWWRSGGWHRGRFNNGRMSYGVLFADKIRSMTDEEFAEFKNNYSSHSYGRRCGCNCGNDHCYGDCDSKEAHAEKK